MFKTIWFQNYLVIVLALPRGPGPPKRNEVGGTVLCVFCLHIWQEISVLLGFYDAKVHFRARFCQALIIGHVYLHQQSPLSVPSSWPSWTIRRAPLSLWRILPPRALWSRPVVVLIFCWPPLLWLSPIREKLNGKSMIRTFSARNISYKKWVPLVSEVGIQEVNPNQYMLS